jgi:TonB family protein
MIFSWMLSATAFTAFVALAAMALQPFARALGWPSRWTWAGGLAVGALWPVLAALSVWMFPPVASAVVLPAITVVPRGSALLAGSLPRLTDVAGDVVVALWAVASVALLVRLVRSIVAVRRLRDRAERCLVDGVSVLVTDSAGPAAIGLRRHSVLLPRDLLAVDEPLRRLVVLHEREHCAARDPWLLLGAAVAVALLPWNVALWFLARRLHLALEIDCDARVLATGADARRYGRLLLLVAQRPRTLALAPTFAAPPTNLERRIDAMRTRLARPRPLQLAAAGLLVAAGVAGACSESVPNTPLAREASPVPPAATPSAAPSGPSTPTAQTATAGKTTKAPSTVTTGQTGMREFQVDEPARQIPGSGMLRYPPSMRTANREGEVYAQFVVDERGLVDMATFEVRTSTDPAFTEAVRAALPTMRFRPAIVKGRAVKQLVEQPFTFALQKSWRRGRETASADPSTARSALRSG